MKKFFSFIIVFLISTAVINGKKISNLIFEKPETKTVRFSIYTGSDYSAKLYKNSKAKVILTIYRFSSNQSEIVWKGEVDKGRIRNYPDASNPVFREISVYNVFESKETLCASYKVIYDTKGSNLSYEDGIVLSKDPGNNSVTIAI